MSQLPYRANLSAKSWPLISTFFGRSIIVGSASHDQNFNRQTYSPEDPDKDIGIPQVYYLHNVMPTSYGLQSIGYVPLIPSIPGTTSVSNIYTMHYTEGSAYLLALSDGRIYICRFGDAAQWALVQTLTNITDRTVSVVNISGISYVYFSNLGCYVYDPTSNTLVPQTLTGLDPTLVLGIVSAVGYMIAYTATGVAWSSTIDPTDFTPSLVTGAGGGGVELAKGPITICVSNSIGFTIYTGVNAVAAVYSGNARYPFNFREIASAGGVTSNRVIARDISDSAHYAYTTIGLQQVSVNSSLIIYPEVTDFISGKYFEDFNEVTNTFTYTDVVDMKKALNIIANRYLVLSYGVNELTHALVLDTSTKRWGKLKITHVDCFEYLLYPAELTEVARESLGFIDKTGTVVRVDFSSDDIDVPHNGVLILGKYQYVRSRLMTLEEVTFENVRSTQNFSLSNMVSIKGKGIDKISPGYLQYDDATALTYKFHDAGMNHSLLLKGGFFGVCLLLRFGVQGYR